ncbi:poly(A) polymerase gamma-like [Bolinopsis microptera]|uniref:poly(A) polymerase gamma-like n=1 Tax=Bolinopsis microptera TaxID=2820187 RepID=UPI00307A16DD
MSLGVTSAISTAEAKPLDIKLSKDLEDVLQRFGVFESINELNKRNTVTQQLDDISKQWIIDITIQQGIPRMYAEKVCGKIVTFGSYRLGVHSQGTDIDLLLVAPRNVTRIDFFTAFFQLLQSQPNVSNLRAIEEAYVPVIKFNFDGIEIDLLFARLTLKSIPDDLKLDDVNLLNYIDEKCLKSLDGCRVTEDILALVHKPDSFKMAVRAVKLWAKRKGIYSNSLGYLGGVSWAILMARVCQMYPNAAPATLVRKFFLVFDQWKWPVPVMLRYPEDIHSGDLQLPVWDPRVNPSDRAHVMPILTPSYPQQNSAFNVTTSTENIISREIKIGQRICEYVFSGKADWNSLFEPSDFFHRYKHYIIIQAMGADNKEHLEWIGLVESKIRILVEDLERCQYIESAHINPTGYTHVDKELYPFTTQWLIGLRIKIPTDTSQTTTLDMTEPIQRFVDVIYLKQAGNKSPITKSMRVKANHVTKRLLPLYISHSILIEGREKGVKRKANNL